MTVAKPRNAPTRSRAAVLCSASLVVLLALALPGLAGAQGTSTSTLEGTAKLQDGSGAPGVTVTVTSPALQGSRTTVTGTQGDYIVKGLPPGDYLVVFTLEGMTSQQAKVNVPYAGLVHQDAQMVPTALSESIVVVAASEAAEAETPTVVENVSKATVDSLPMQRTPDQIALLAPNTVKGILGGQIEIGGSFGYDNLFLVNGVDINDSVFGNPDTLYIEDAILETQVQTSAVSAEYGRFGGGIVNAVTKSGGNKFTGSLRDDRTNPSYRQRTPVEQSRGTKLVNKNNDAYSGTLGGFIMKDHLWFFGAARSAKTTTQSTLVDTLIPYNRLGNDKRYEGKLTANLSNSHTLTGSYLKVDNATTRPLLGGNDATLDTITTGRHPTSLLAFRYDGILTPSMFAEVQYSEKKFKFDGEGGRSRDLVQGSPIFALTSSIQYNAPYFDANDPESRNNKQYGGSLSYFLTTKGAGSHDVKFGGEEFKNIRTGGNSQSPTSQVLISDPLRDAAGNIIFDSGGHAIPVFVPGQSLNILFLASIGSVFQSKTDAVYLNDSWHYGDHFAFNLGARAEKATNSGTDNIKTVSGTRVVPRLSATYDPEGKGRFRINVGYAEYAGSYNLGIFTNGTSTGNPAYIYGVYTGPAGQGRGFTPGFDPANYAGFLAANPIQNVRFGHGAKSPVTKEYTGGVDYVFGRDGFLRLVYQNRKAYDLLEVFTNPSFGTTHIVVQGIDGGIADNLIYKNTSFPQRKYEALLLQGRYRLKSNWSLEGNWTHELKNDGNYQGQVGQALGPEGIFKYPEFFSLDRNYPLGRLPEYQKDVARLWTVYNLNIGRAGALNFSLLGTHGSPLTYSLVALAVPLTPQQLARDPGYAQQPQNQNLYFGKRGSQQWQSYNLLDAAVAYEIPIFSTVSPWLKVSCFNVFNSKAQIGGNTTIHPDPNSPRDALGLPTGFIKGPRFGQGQANADYVAPREFQFSLAVHF
jgi:hypothetical protein